MSGLARIYNPFRYPGIRPGFDTSHPASNGILFSTIFSYNGVNVIGLNNINLGAIINFNGTVTNGIDGATGPSLNISTFSNFHFGGGLFGGTTTNKKCTLACIIRSPGDGNFTYRDGNSTYGTEISVASATLSFIKNGSGSPTTVSSGIPIAASVPYFIAASSDDSVGVNFVTTRLDTGQIQSAFVANATAVTVASPGSHIMETPGFAFSCAAWMYNNTVALNLGLMRQWAASPWAFWYPPDPTTLGLGVIGLNSSAPPVVTLDVLGNPIYRVRREGWGW